MYALCARTYVYIHAHIRVGLCVTAYIWRTQDDMWSRLFPSSFTWVLGIELRSRSLHSKHLYLISHHTNPIICFRHTSSFNTVFYGTSVLCPILWLSVPKQKAWATRRYEQENVLEVSNWVLWPAWGCSEHGHHSVLRKLSHRGGEFKSSLDYRGRPCPQTQLLQLLK